MVSAVISVKPASGLEKFLVFLCMSTTLYSIDLFGRVYLSEILLLFASIASIFLRKNVDADLDRFSIARNLLALALISQLLTDFIRATPGSDILKGSALIIFAFSNLLGFQTICRGSRILALWGLLGFLMGFCLNLLFFQDNYAGFGKMWKYGFGYSSILIVLIASHLILKRDRIFSGGILILMSIISLSLNARNLAFICLLSAVWFYFSGQEKSMRIGLKRILSLTVVVALSLFIGSFFYNQYLESSAGLNAETKKFINQGTDLKILAKGRTEIISQGVAVQNSPFLGHGSYAANTDRLKESTSVILSKLGFSNFETSYFFNFYKGKIPVHSGLFQFYVWFGLMSAFFWIYVLYCSILKLLRGKNPLFLIMMILNLVWDVLFSPFGSIARLSLMITVAIIFLSLKNEEVTS
jgi:hypothetical protein